jgi:hypothetical protein
MYVSFYSANLMKIPKINAKYSDLINKQQL